MRISGNHRGGKKHAFRGVALAALLLSGCGGGSGGSSPPPVSLPGPTPTPAPTPAPTATPAPTGTIAMPAVTAAANASITPNLYIIVGTRAGVVYRYEKGSFPPTSTFAIASASKLVASLTIQRLVDRGVMRLDDNPQRYLTYWTSNAADQRSRVTLAHLLSFTSGFNTDDTTAGCIADGTTTTALCARALYEAGPTSAPGAAFAYGPAHMQIAASMAEAATGKSWAVLVRDELATPLALTTTFYASPSASNPRISGGGVSSIEDYAKLMAGLLDATLIRDPVAFRQNRTIGLPIINQPDNAVSNGQWHYALGAWRECDDIPFSARCSSQNILSSPGAFGWTPWVDFDRGYWAIIGMQQGFGGSNESVRLEQQIQPLIAAALGVP